MTPRSILLGLLGAAGLAALTYFNDLYLKNTFLSASYFPVSAVGLLILTALFLHPVIRHLAPGWVLTRAEMATAFSLLLCSVFVPSRGLGHNFTNLLMLPFHHERTRPGWQGQPPHLTERDVLDGERLARELDSGKAPASVLALRPSEWRPPTPGGTLTEAQRAQLLTWLNAVIQETALEPHAVARDRPEIRVLLRIPPERRTAIQRARLTRAALEEWFDGALRSRRAGVLEMVEPRMLADPAADPTALEGFVTGLGSDTRPIGFRDVPWAAWRGTLIFWIPVILTMVLTSLGLALVVHRQWMHHEHLPFPTMEFARSILPNEDGTLSRLVRPKSFWIGMAVVSFIHLINYLHEWWRDRVIPVRLQIDFTPLVEIAPVFRQGWGWWVAFNPTIYFTIIGFAYFLANDVSLSLGLAPYMFALISGIAAGYGMAMGGTRLHPHMETFINSGAFAGLFVMLAYSGRHYFRAAFGRGFGLPIREPVESHAVWGARATLLGFGLMVAQIVALGVEWPFAVMYTFWLMLVPLVISRMLAESGVFFLNPRTYACSMLWGIFGAAAIGRQPLLMLSMLTMALLIHASLSFLPFAVSALRLCDETGVRLGRIAFGGLAAVAIALAVMVPVNLRIQYRYGAFAAGDSWTSGFIPTAPFENAVFVTRQLEAQGALEVSDRLHGWERWKHISPRVSSLVAFGVVFGLVMLFGYARHRFPRWPLHPVMFAVMAIWPSHYVGFSFLIGWMVKAFVMKYGGARLYQNLKPLMLGLVAGEALGALVPAAIGILYYLITGSRAPTYSILPG